MKIFVFILAAAITVNGVAAQKVETIINAAEVERIERVLSADDMEGRRTFTRGIEKAAAFIAEELKQSGLQTLNKDGNYLQTFKMIRAKFQGLSASFDGVPLNDRQVIAITCKPELQVSENAGYELVKIEKGANFFAEARKYTGLTRNAVVLVDTSFAASFGRLTQLKSQLFQSDKSVVFVLSNQVPVKYSIEAKHQIQEQTLSNVVGVLPGKSLAHEYVIFSGHYDHLGINSSKAVNNDSIFNGANDDAAGTTAMIMLAKYYAKANNNERTLIFAAFTAEEIGGFGATYFSRQLDPSKVMAMFNIEMIGTESKWGANSAYITGFEKTDMGKILQNNLKGTGFDFYPDPYPDQQLFYRSDNATLARLGVPAHTISTSKMDSEPNYHKASDEIGTLNIPNMTRIIQSIALSARGIVSGKETPTRVDAGSLR